MRISDKGVEFIKKEEGCVLTAYKCPAGVYTIGYGCTKNVKDGDKITLERAEELLRADLRHFENVVNKNIKVDLTQDQFDSLVSFSFNVGGVAFADSTLVKKINANAPIEEIEEQFRRWNKGGGKVLPVLVRRREREIKLYKGEC